MSASREKKQRQGGGPSEKALQADQKQAEYKRKVRTYTGIGVVVVILVAALLIWNSGFFQGRAAAATVGGEKLSAAEMSYYYYASRTIYTYMGLDTTVPDDEQMYNEEEGITFHDQILADALEGAQSTQALYDAALEDGYTQANIQEQLDAYLDSFKSSATASGYSYKSYLVANYGKFMTPGIFEELLAKELLASQYATDTRQEYYDSYTMEQLEDFYQENKDDLDQFEYSYLYFTAGDVDETDEDGNELSEEEIEELEEQALADAKAQAEQAQQAYEDGGEIADLIEEMEPNGSGDHTVADGISSVASAYRDELLELEEGESVIVENGESGYYMLVSHGRSRSEDLTADVRHILIRAETTQDEEGATVEPTKPAWTEAESKAEEILAEFEAGAQTAEAFGELANQYSDDGGSNTTGGLYEKIARDDSYVEEFLEWIFADGRQAGDTGIVRHEGDPESTSAYWGYHVMYFQGWDEAEWVLSAREQKSQEEATSWQEELLESGDYETAVLDGAKYLGA